MYSDTKFVIEYYESDDAFHNSEKGLNSFCCICDKSMGH